ncbi:hypothetical protein BB561_000737 [Smittium simulii]|uniref:SGNH hydrolase-type esterase domain-containing protein n=1 Tax=Smittium simulii TaxID=133385 RepID=A0A2T9YXY4_9FUNG|nr:hypothetical protein BB561_000737 [Smittium simulii]
MLQCFTRARAFELFQNDFFSLIHLFLVCFINWLLEPPSQQGFHKIVVIGDQFGLGIGDTIFGNGLTGLCDKLLILLNSSYVVKLNWLLYNKAEYEAQSSDWLLSSPKKLFQRLFEDPKYYNCEFVVVMLGSQDYIMHQTDNTTFTADKTFQNIVCIVEALERLGKRVVISFIPNPESWNLKKSKNIENCFAHQVNTKLMTKYQNSSVTLGPLCDISNYKYFRSDFYEPFRPNFNKKGYKFYASEMFDVILPKVVKFELEYLIEQS